MLKLVVIFFIIFGSLGLILGANAENNFNPNFIISDEEILDSQAMNLSDIQRLLENKNSFLANYTCPDANGVNLRASEIIYNAATKNYDCDRANLSVNPTDEEKAQKCRKININPKFLIVLLQKEQSLIEDYSPRQSQLDWATGYGCPDGASCISRWKGFGKQVNSAALQFFDYMINPDNYSFQSGQTYAFTNPYSSVYRGSSIVTPANRATAALYNYTPHVYNGNYNFYNIWQRYFTRSYPDGSLLQAKGEETVWLIQKGKKRPFLSKGALTSRFDINKIISVNKSDLEKYEKGAEIKFAQYSFLRSPKGTVYLLIDDKKYGFTTREALRKVGVNPEEIIDANWDEINVYDNGKPITATSTYLFGALLQNKITGGVYWVMDGTKAPLIDAIFLKTKYSNKKITKVTPEELDKYQTVAPVNFNNGELLKTTNQPGVFILTDGYRRPFSSGDIFEKLGYKWTNIIIVPEKILIGFPLGEPILETGLNDTQIVPLLLDNDDNFVPNQTATTSNNATSSNL